MEIRFTHSAIDRDSLLLPMNARTVDLMLQYRIRLVRCEPTTHFHVNPAWCTGNGILHDRYGTFHLDPWTDPEWLAFRVNFVNVIMRYWDHKFELRPSRPWFQARRGVGAPEAARITCSLSIDLVDPTEPAHHTYHIIKPQETDFRSFTAGRRGIFTHRDLARGEDSARTRVDGAWQDVTYFQSPVLHEFGHTLGLHHVNGRGNSNASYGITLQQRHDIMGMGENPTARAARPWISQLEHHVKLAPRDPRLRFTARVVSFQWITYWYDDMVAPAAAAP